MVAAPQRALSRLAPGALQDLVGDPYRSDGLSHVVSAHDVGPRQDRGHMGGQRALPTLIDLQAETLSQK